MEPVEVRDDRALVARVTRRTPMRYAAGADPREDRPAHVRAGSGIAWIGGRLAVVQDDANFVALVHPHDGSAHPVTLPRGAGGKRQFDDGRGNKRFKLDLEAAVAVPAATGTLLLALGSGSTPRREHVVAIHDVAGESAAPEVRLHHLPGLYRALREASDFAGSELNVEAAVHLARGTAARLRLFNRGNGARSEHGGPANATCDLDWLTLAAHLARPDDPSPVPIDIVRYELGGIDGCALGFTDAALVDEHETGVRTRRLLFTAAAEASPDATRDGPVAGCVVGIITEQGTSIVARRTVLRDARGRAFEAKVEGLALDRSDARRAWVVVDRDSPDEPSELCEVALEGPWLG